MTLGNTPKRLTNIFLEANKSFALNVRFKYHNGDPFDLTDHVLRLSADAPKHLNGDEVITLVADHVDSVGGHAQFKFQASDTNLEPAEYAFDMTLLPPNQYSIPVLKGNIIIGLNAEEINDNVFVDNVHTNEDVVVLFGTSCDVEVRFNPIELLEGPQGDKGDTGDPSGVFVQPDTPAPGAIPPFLPLWVDTDAEYHHSGYVYEAPEPDPDMPTGVLYFDNDETVIPPDGVGVLYVKDQNGDLIPVTRYGPPGPDGPEGPPGVGVIVQPDEPLVGSLPEGAMWVDEDSVVPPVGGGGGGLDQATADGLYVNVDGDTMTGPLTGSFIVDAGVGEGVSTFGITGMGMPGISASGSFVIQSMEMGLLSDAGITVGALDGSAQRITNVDTPTNAADVVNKAYTDARTPKIIVLSAAAPVPGGTPAGTVIIRTVT